MLAKEHEYAYIFMTLLHRKLKEKIKAGIHIGTYGDCIIVQIVLNGMVDYEYKIRDFSTKLLHDYTTDYAVYEIVTAYKKYILAKHFC